MRGSSMKSATPFLLLASYWCAVYSQECAVYHPEQLTPPSFCASTFATGLSGARGLFLDSVLSNGDLLVVARGESLPTVYAVWGSGGSKDRAPIARMAGLNHAVVVAPNRQGGAWLFASSSNSVYRWSYFPGSRHDLGSPTIVISGMDKDENGNSQGGHSTRTMLFDNQHRLYVAVGSIGNVDKSSYRSRIRRFSGMTAASPGTVDFSTGEVFADGLRNEVGLALDNTASAVWGVENGPDQLSRSDLGSNINNDAVGEELNKFPIDDPGKFYGYPYCWSEFKLASSSLNPVPTPTAQWSWPSSPQDDAWCKDEDNVVKPIMTMQAHSAPLGIVFYNATTTCSICDESCSEVSIYRKGPGSFPCSMLGDAFVAYHGSWNRKPSTGYKVVRIPFQNGVPGAPIDFFHHGSIDEKWPTNLRPVDVVFDTQGRLLVSSDTTDEVIMISYTSISTSSDTSSPSSKLPCCSSAILSTTTTPNPDVKSAAESKISASNVPKYSLSTTAAAASVAAFATILVA